jgi:hypothetical protein
MLDSKSILQNAIIQTRNADAPRPSRSFGNSGPWLHPQLIRHPKNPQGQIAVRDRPFESPNPLAGHRVAKAVSWFTSEERVPAIAPRWLLEQPLWHEPERAIKHAHFRRDFVATDPHNGFSRRMILETNNDIAGQTGRHSPGGLLRWLDMDIAVALSRAWTENRSKNLECFQKDLLTWMGYHSSNRHHSPYREIRGSIDRLRRTAIALYAYGDDRSRVPWFTILSEGNLCQEQLSGRRVILQAQLSDAWTKVLSSLEDWTIFDIECYAHLARTNLRLGLSRAMYLYFAANRDWKTMQFSVSVTALHEQFGDRSGIDGPLIYRNAFNQKSRLRRAIDHLAGSGVIRFSDVTRNHLLNGEFIRPSSLITFATIEQERAHRIGTQEELPFLTGPLLALSAQSVEAQVAIPKNPPRTVPKIFHTFTELLPSLRPALLQRACDNGWTQDQLSNFLGYLFWKEANGGVHSLIGLAVRLLDEGITDPQHRELRWCWHGISSEIGLSTREEWIAWTRKEVVRRRALKGRFTEQRKVTTSVPEMETQP